MLRRTLVSLALAALALGQSGCLLLPVRTAPGVEGRVIEAATRRPLAGALVVVRFDGRHGDLLPDREHLGHAEVRTDADGRFRIGRRFEPGVALWPFFAGEARVVSVLADGYRCPRPRKVSSEIPVEITLAPALDRADQRESCRPVAARPGEAAVYMAGWRSLYDDEGADREQDEQRRLEQILAARSALGFGENCEGPVLDLALSPDGQTAAYAAREKEGTAVHVVELAADGPLRPVRVGAAPRTPPRRLAWTSPGQLVLWEPASEPLRAASSARLAEGPVEVIWRAPAARAKQPPPPAARARKPQPPARPAAPGMPLEPEDIYDEGASRWEGRGFTLVRGLDAATGLARDQLRVIGADGERHAVDLPGEPCGPTGHFGRPQYRITADGSHAIDLRFTDGGCRAVWIDLESGAWSALDRTGSARSECRTERRIPPSHLRVALRGYLRQVDTSLEEAGLDPTRAYVLQIDPSGTTHVEMRDAGGKPQRLRVDPFPVATPLRAVHVANVASVHRVGPSKPAAKVPATKRPAASGPLPEPL
jgi:hypothetical protein